METSLFVLSILFVACASIAFYLAVHFRRLIHIMDQLIKEIELSRNDKRKLREELHSADLLINELTETINELTIKINECVQDKMT